MALRSLPGGAHEVRGTLIDEYPMLDIDGTLQQLDEVVRGLQAALASRA